MLPLKGLSFRTSMTALNIDILIDIYENNIDELNSVFRTVLHELEHFLQLKPVTSNVVVVERSCDENIVKCKNIVGVGDRRRFQDCFDQLFHYLGIDKYLIMYDMVDGTSLLKHVYGNLDFLNTYNPIRNLKWNKKDKIWINHKLYGENFEVIYPKLD